jgi:hypothetical protein
MVWRGFRIIFTVCLRVAIIVRNQGCGNWMFAALRRILLQLAIPPSTGLIK